MLCIRWARTKPISALKNTARDREEAGLQDHQPERVALEQEGEIAEPDELRHPLVQHREIDRVERRIDHEAGDQQDQRQRTSGRRWSIAVAASRCMPAAARPVRRGVRQRRLPSWSRRPWRPPRAASVGRGGRVPGRAGVGRDRLSGRSPPVRSRAQAITRRWTGRSAAWPSSSAWCPGCRSAPRFPAAPAGRRCAPLLVPGPDRVVVDRALRRLDGLPDLEVEHAVERRDVVARRRRRSAPRPARAATGTRSGPWPPACSG